MILEEQNRPFSGQSFADTLQGDGVASDEAYRVLQQLLREEVLFPPHLP